MLAPDQHRRLGGLDAEGAQHRLGLLVGLEVLELVGHAIAGQKLPQAQRVARVTRSDQPHATADLNQDRASGQEGSEHDVGEVLVLAQQLEQVPQRHPDHLARIANHRAQVHARPGEQVELAEETVPPVDRDHAVLIAVAADDRDRPRLDDVEVVGRVALAEQHVARRDRLDRAQFPQAPALLIVQPRKGAVTVGRLLEARSQRLAHDPSATRNATSST